MPDPFTVFVAATPDAWVMSDLVRDELGRSDLRALQMKVPEPGWDSETLETGHGLVLVIGGQASSADVDGLISWARVSGRPTAVSIESTDETFSPERYHELGAGMVVVHRPDDDLSERAGLVARYMHQHLRGTALPAIDLTLHPPVERPEPDDAAVIGAEVESLLTWAERFVADESNPDDLRDEVDARRRQLVDELRLMAQERGSSTVLTGLTAALLPLVRPAPADDDLGAAADGVADAAIALGEASTPDEIVDAGEDVVEALDHMGNEISQVVEARGWQDVRAAWFRGMERFVAEDFWTHLNAFIVAARERVLPAAATGTAGGVVANWMGGPPWLVVTVVALGLLRARFPWIFRPQEETRPPEE